MNVGLLMQNFQDRITDVEARARDIHLAGLAEPASTQFSQMQPELQSWRAAA